MAEQPRPDSTSDKPDAPLAETGKPDDPARKENPDTRDDQLKPFADKNSDKDDQDPALETTRKAGQGSG